MIRLTAVIPVCNEAASLAELCRQLRAAERQAGYKLRIVLVDDGSTDTSWHEIETLAAADPGVLGIRLRRNFGKAAALMAGIDLVDDPLIVTLDGDLQDDPGELPLLVAKLEQGFDVVSGWKIDRRDPWHKTIPSRFFNRMVGWLTGVRLHDHNCGFKVYRREVFNEVQLYGELHRFVPVLAAARGFKIAEVPVNHRPRVHGHSKYGLFRMVKGFLDLLTVKFITGYGHRPQHMLGSAGLLALLIGGLLMTYLAGKWVTSRLVEGWDPVNLHETAMLYYAVALLLLGGQFLSIGLMGEMMTAFLVRKTDLYSISQYTNPEVNTTKTHPELPEVRT
jgi:dolichol-phosphate mannosyltransferase